MAIIGFYLFLYHITFVVIVNADRYLAMLNNRSFSRTKYLYFIVANYLEMETLTLICMEQKLNPEFDSELRLSNYIFVFKLRSH